MDASASLSFDDARARILADFAAGRLRRAPETVALDALVGRVLAEDVLAGAPLPAADFSAMDGYAFAAADTPGTLRVTFEARAGAPATGRCQTGTAARIFTGAAIPEGADAVAAQEDVARSGDTIDVRDAVRVGRHVRRAGEDIARGALALARGTRLLPAHVGLLAALDRADAVVAARPRVLLLTTGDELRAPGSSPREGSLPDANGPMIAALAVSAGAMVVARERLADDAEATRDAVARALERADLVVTLGGVSAGDHDLVRAALAAAGVTLEVTRVAMKPGKPVVAGRRGDVRVLALPGNPAAAFVTFAVFGVPLLRAMQGDARPLPTTRRVHLAHAASAATGRVELARATLEGDTATLLANQSAGALTSLAVADALLLLRGDARAGDAVDALCLADL